MVVLEEKSRDPPSLATANVSVALKVVEISTSGPNEQERESVVAGLRRVHWLMNAWQD